MKKLLLLLAVAVGALTARADTGAAYPYLTFETTDGNVVSVPVSSLTLTVSGTTLTAGDKTFPLSNLTKMHFSTSDETTGISHPTVADEDEVVEIYDLNGLRVTQDQMQKGVYIVKSVSGTYKLITK